MKFSFNYQNCPINIDITATKISITIQNRTGDQQLVESIYNQLITLVSDKDCLKLPSENYSDKKVFWAKYEGKLELMLSVWQFLDEHASEIRLQESDCYALKSLTPDQMDRNDFINCIKEECEKNTSQARVINNCKTKELTAKKNAIPARLQQALSYMVQQSYNSSYLQQIPANFYQQTKEILRDKIYLTPLMAYDLAKIITPAYERAVTAHKINSFWGRIGWTSCDFAVELSNKFKQLMVRDCSPQLYGQIKSSHPIDICYEIFAYYNNEDNLDSDEQKALHYLKLAIELGGDTSLTALIEKIGEAFILKHATISGRLVLHIINHPGLREKLTNRQIETIIKNTVWSEEQALELVQAIADSPVIDDFSALESVSHFPSVNFALLSCPSLVERLEEKAAVIQKACHAPLLKELDKVDLLQLRRFIKTISEADDEITANHPFTSKQLTAQYTTIFQKLEEKAAQEHAGFQLLVGELYSKDTPFNQQDLQKCAYFLKRASASSKYKDQALHALIKVSNTVENDDIKYTIGCIYHDRLDGTTALNYFSQISPESEHYDEAMYNCGMKYVAANNSDKALEYFNKIHNKAYYGGLEELTRICSTNLPKLRRESTDAAPRETNSEEQPQVRLEQLQAVVKDYNNIKKGFFKSRSSLATRTALQNAISSKYDDMERYQILRDYVLEKSNSHREFCRLLKNTFGECFFQEDKYQQDTQQARM